MWSVDTNVSVGYSTSIFMNGSKKTLRILTLHVYIQSPHDRPKWRTLVREFGTLAFVNSEKFPEFLSDYQRRNKDTDAQ